MLWELKKANWSIKKAFSPAPEWGPQVGAVPKNPGYVSDFYQSGDAIKNQAYDDKTI